LSINGIGKKEETWALFYPRKRGKSVRKLYISMNYMPSRLEYELTLSTRTILATFREYIANVAISIEVISIIVNHFVSC
jgi:intergrase/recombinase